MQLPQLGSCIGVVGQKGGGTLGGFFDLYCEDKKHAVFLTNSHVVKPPTSAPEEIKIAALQFGMSYRTPASDPRRTLFQYPAIKDFETLQKQISSRIEGAEAQIESLEASIEEYEEIGKRSGNLRRQKADLDVV